MRPDAGALKQSIDTALEALLGSNELRRIWQAQLPTIEYPGL